MPRRGGRKDIKEGRKEADGDLCFIVPHTKEGRKEGRLSRKEGRKATWIDVVARVPRRAIAVAFPVTGKQQLEGKKRKERRKEGREGKARKARKERKERQGKKGRKSCDN